MLKGIIFDLDGTLVDSHYDWNLIRRKLGVKNLPILTYINNLNGVPRNEAIKILETFENQATQKARLKKWTKKIFVFLSDKGIKKAIVTNNSCNNVEYLLNKWNLTFDGIVTRDDGVWKPSGKPLELAIKRINLEKKEVLFIGDSTPDRLAAKDAGISFISVEQNKSTEEIITKIIDRINLPIS